MAEPEFTVEFGAAPGLAGGVLVTLSGPIDSKSVLVFKAQVEALRRRRVRHFLLEMGQVRHEGPRQVFINQLRTLIRDALLGI